MKSISNRLVLRRGLKTPELKSKPQNRFTGVTFFELSFAGITPGKTFRIATKDKKAVRYIKVSRTHADKLETGDTPWRRSGNPEPVDPTTICLMLTQEYKDWMRAKYEADKG